jgi:hypothetical protein
MNTQEFTNKQQDIDSEFVEIVDRNFWEMISPLTENPKSVTHEVVIPDQGSSGKLDPKPCIYPNSSSMSSNSSKVLKCPHCKQIIHPPTRA